MLRMHSSPHPQLYSRTQRGILHERVPEPLRGSGTLFFGTSFALQEGENETCTTMKRHLLFLLSHLFIIYSGNLQAQTACDTLYLSLNDALLLAERENRAVKIAQNGVDMATQDKHLLRSAWWPTITLTGEATHTTTPIRLTKSIAELSDGSLQELEEVVSGEPLLEAILKQVGDLDIGVNLAPRNTASVGANVVWPLFSGGKRIFATRAGNYGVELANTAYEGVLQTVRSAIAEVYMGVEVAEASVDVYQMALCSALEVVREARSLEREGIINKAERLAAEVGAAEVASQLAGAHTRLTIARAELGALLGVDSIPILTTTPLLDITPLPPQDYFLQAIDDNPSLKATRIEKQLAHEKLHIEQGRYLPDIALIGGHRLWSKGFDKGLIPRTFVGVGASWTLFDGTARERSIAKSRSLVRTAQLAEQRQQQELRVAVERLWGTLSASHNQLATANTTIALAEELVRMRRRALSEGMATASEVIRSEVTLAEARLGRIAVVYQWNIARTELFALCGLSQTENIQQ